jgi:hypothetical protein
MSDPPNKDRELDAYLSGDSSLSKAYKEGSLELPPAHLDARILAQAHRADADRKTRRARSPFSGSWMVPASVTAVVLLAVSVAVLLPEGRPGHERRRDGLDDAMAPEAEINRTGKLEQRESNQAPAAVYAPPPPNASESTETDSGGASRQASPVAPAPAERAVSPPEVQPSAAAPAARPDVGAASDSALKRSAVGKGAEAAAEEGLAGGARSEAIADADAWLAQIGSLIDRGELEAARQSLVEFRRYYPAVKVPQRISEALEGGGN